MTNVYHPQSSAKYTSNYFNISHTKLSQSNVVTWTVGKIWLMQSSREALFFLDVYMSYIHIKNLEMILAIMPAFCMLAFFSFADFYLWFKLIWIYSKKASEIFLTDNFLFVIIEVLNICFSWLLLVFPKLYQLFANFFFE